MNSKNLQFYCKLFSKLKVSKRFSSQAYYKPILILSVIDLISQGCIDENKILVSEQLIHLFDRYWNILVDSETKYKGGLQYPFIHLISEGFWNVIFYDDYDQLPIKTINKLKKSVKYAVLEQELFDFLKDPFCRNEIILSIIANWFANHQKELKEILNINHNLQNASLEKNDDFLVFDHNEDPKFSFKKSALRQPFFSKSIVHIYQYKCSICGLKTVNSLMQNIVEGAHIKPHSLFYDNNLNNGIALCKNHHWAFDHGLFCIDDCYNIVVSGDFQEESPNGELLQNFDDEPMILPVEEKYYPRLESLDWHRKNVFLG